MTGRKESSKRRRKDPNRWTEAGVVKKGDKLFAVHNAYVCNIKKGKYQTTGDPDKLHSVYGYFVAVEYKCGYNQPTARQLGKLDDIQNAGGLPLCINETRLPALQALLDIMKETHMAYEPTVIDRTIGPILKRVRDNRKLNLREVSEACGVHKSTLSRYENGDSALPFPLFILLCRHYDADTDKVLAVFQAQLAKAEAAEAADEEG